MQSSLPVRVTMKNDNVKIQQGGEHSLLYLLNSGFFSDHMVFRFRSYLPVMDLPDQNRARRLVASLCSRPLPSPANPS